MMYLRFVLQQKHPDSGIEDGIFSAAYKLQDDEVLSKFERDELETLLSWFRANLKIPTRFNKTKSKGYQDRQTTKGVSWLKGTASEHVSMMRQMSELLKNQGVHVTMIKTARPGYVVYEDDYQVVAEPFSDLKR